MTLFTPCHFKTVLKNALFSVGRVVVYFDVRTNTA
jgi:hypothetical protein